MQDGSAIISRITLIWAVNDQELKSSACPALEKETHMKTLSAPTRNFPVLKLAALLTCALILCGFSFSDPKKLTQEIKEEIKVELQKIAEKTPSAKLRADWRTKRDSAEAALKKAETADASKYCPEKWDEAVALFKKAKHYASLRSYRKAIFLAKKAEKTAGKAATAAAEIISKKTAELKGTYKRLRLQADDISASIPPDAEKLSAKAAELSLALEDARLAIELRQFEDAQKSLPVIKADLVKLEKLVRAYKKAHPPPDEEEEN